jgi:hypothetical protein
MAKKSPNGSKPAENASNADADGEPVGTAEFERFERLTRLLVTVPKEDIDRELEREKRKPARSR